MSGLGFFEECLRKKIREDLKDSMKYVSEEGVEDVVDYRVRRFVEELYLLLKDRAE